MYIDEQASSQSVRKSVAPPSHEELSTFYEALSKTGKPAVLSLHPDYSDSYVLDHSKLSTPLSSLLNEECSELPYDELLVKCEEVFEKIQLSTSQANNIEIATRAQSQSKIWFVHRTGRVTASRFKGAACTDLSQPSQSLLKAICYPDRYKFTTLATKWGCEHEKTARNAYIVKK